MKVLTDEEVGTHLNIVDNIMSVHSHEDISLSFHAVFDSHKLANAEIARLEQWAKDKVEIDASGGRLDAYREMGRQLADRENTIDWLRVETKKQSAEIERLKAATLTCEAFCTEIRRFTLDEALVIILNHLTHQFPDRYISTYLDIERELFKLTESR